jgi:hypothetical protein
LFVQRLSNALQRLPLISIGIRNLPHSLYNVFSRHADLELMDPNAPRPKRQDNVLSTLNVAIDAMNLAGGISDIIPAKAVFGTVSVILTMIRVDIILHCLC